MRKSNKKPFRLILFLALILIISFGSYLYVRPVPVLEAKVSFKVPSKDEAIALPWPAYGQSAMGALGYGVLATNGQQVPVPTASVTKAMTALAVLKQKPLKSGEQGPIIALTPADVEIYNDYYTRGGSIAKVAAGESIAQYQALQALLLPSANNYADTLATWAFGSMDKYTTYANQLADTLGMKDTSIADASGFSPQTKSTARDLVILGENVLKNPVLADIVSQQQATIPEAGTITNVNWLLGMDNVVGIKTGSTDEAGGCYLFASKRQVNGQSVTIIGAIMAAPSRNIAISDARPLIRASDSGFKKIEVASAGQKVGSYSLPWGGTVDATAKNGVSLLTWKGSDIQAKTVLNPVATTKSKGEETGIITIQNGNQKASTTVVLAQDITQPSWHWRIFSR